MGWESALKIEMASGFSKRLQRTISRFDFEIGILDDKPHREAVQTSLFEAPKLSSYAGGPVRKATRNESGKTIGEVLVENMERTNTNFLLEPFQKESSDIVKFMNQFLKLALSRRGSFRRIENLLQAIVRNPILRGDYGPNTSYAADNKGFDRHLIDTGQMFKAIKAKIRASNV